MTPFHFIQYVALEQLDSFAVDGTARALGGFSRIAEEADEYANHMFDSYGQRISEGGDPGEFAEEALNQAAEYYSVLSNLRQSIVNLLAAGLYHLFEQHRNKLSGLLEARGQVMPQLQNLEGWAKLDELRLVANTVKHAEGRSAQDLRKIRPDLFVPHVIKGSSLEKHALQGATENPLGGTDLFVTEKDLENYRDTIRQVWESLRTIVG